MLFEYKGLEIEISKSYILISSISINVLEAMSYELLDELLECEAVVSYDRLDGEDYYLDYVDDEVVQFISDMIKLHNI